MSLCITQPMLFSLLYFDHLVLAHHFTYSKICSTGLVDSHRFEFACEDLKFQFNCIGQTELIRRHHSSACYLR